MVITQYIQWVTVIHQTGQKQGDLVICFASCSCIQISDSDVCKSADQYGQAQFNTIINHPK